MRDQFGRTIDYIRVSVTDRCNLRCVYCMPAEGVPYVPHREILDFDEITRICRIGAELGISLDTLDPGRYREVTRGGSVEKALEGLHAAAEYRGLGVKVNCVPLKEADDEEYIRLARFAEEGKADVRFIEMMPIGMGKSFEGRSGEDICAVLSRVYGKPEVYSGRLGNGPAVYVRFPGFRKYIGFISAVSHQFCGGCNRIRLTAEGYLKPCLQYGEGADLRALLRNGAEDEGIRAAMERTIYEKPPCHQFTGPGSGRQRERTLETKEMSRIGG